MDEDIRSLNNRILIARLYKEAYDYGRNYKDGDVVTSSPKLNKDRDKLADISFMGYMLFSPYYEEFLRRFGEGE